MTISKYKIMYWKEIPVQIKVEDDKEVISQPLDDRFQQAVDAISMFDGSSESDDYLMGWNWGDEIEIEGNAKNVAEKIAEKYNVGDTISGKVVSIMNYGIFIEIEKGIEGLIHISEVSWKKNVENLENTYNVGDNVDSKILSIDIEDQKISLGIKQLSEDPWEKVATKFSVDDKVTGTILNTTKFGAYVNLGDDIEGFIRNIDLHWTKNISHAKELVDKDDNVEAVILEIVDKDRKIFLGVKQLSENPWSDIKKKYESGQKIQGVFNNLNDSGMIIDLDNDIEGFIPIDNISKKLKKNYLSSIKQGDSIDLLVVEVNEKDKRIVLMLDQPDED